jgi:mannose/fructose/N-acetylgalactosamine-specific phosphotransferase system component IIC
MIEIINLSLLAAIIGLDVTAFGQFMISQPIICGPIFGYIMGDMKTGLWIGMIVELLWVKVIPMGAAIPHNYTAIAIFAIFWGIRSGICSNSVFILSLLVAIPLGMLFRPLDIWMRYMNVKVVHWVDDNIKRGNEDAIGFGIGIGIFLFFLRSFIFYIILFYPGLLIVRLIYHKLPMFAINGLNICWWVLPVAGFGMMFYNFHHKFFSIKS